MKKKIARKAHRTTADPLAAVEYDFSKGVTGKYAARYWAAQAKTRRPRRTKPA